MPILSWIKTHKLSTLLLVILAFVLFRQSAQNSVSMKSQRFMGNDVQTMEMGVSDAMPIAGGGIAKSMPILPPSGGEAEPQPEITDRMVIRESTLSLLVKNVPSARDEIISKAQNLGGYMVSAYTSNPGEAPSATVTIRVAEVNLKTMLETLRGMAIKVVSENLSGTDVTDQYVDIEKHIALLEKTMAKFTAILDQAKEISDITNLNRQIINIQNQIDNLKGSQMALSKNAQLARITVYLSTDEIALPYAPDEMWRPDVIFKLAVRSLITDLRGLGTKAIWIIVYAVIWVPIALIAWFVWRFVSARMK